MGEDKEEEEEDGKTSTPLEQQHIRKTKMKMLMSWLPLLCRANNGTDAPILSMGERSELEMKLEEIISTLDEEEEQEMVLSLWLHHFTYCSASDWPNLRSCYTRWYSASRARLLLAAAATVNWINDRFESFVLIWCFFLLYLEGRTIYLTFPTNLGKGAFQGLELQMATGRVPIHLKIPELEPYWNLNTESVPNSIKKLNLLSKFIPNPIRNIRILPEPAQKQFILLMWMYLIGYPYQILDLTF